MSSIIRNCHEQVKFLIQKFTNILEKPLKLVELIWIQPEGQERQSTRSEREAKEKLECEQKQTRDRQREKQCKESKSESQKKKKKSDQKGGCKEKRAVHPVGE